jgi:esterase/lipase superfamily enzyme
MKRGRGLHTSLTRRSFLCTAAASALTLAGRDVSWSAELPVARPIVTALLRPSSNSDHNGVEEVLYATNRSATSSDDVKKRFGYERSASLSFGRASVTVTRRTKEGIPAAHLTNLMKTSRSGLGFRSSVVRPRNVILFVPCSGTSFSRAVEVAAQMRADLQTSAVIIAFSWPSQDTPWRLSSDEAELSWATSDLTQFVLELLKSPGVNDLQVICEGIAARAVVQTLSTIHDSGDRSLLNQIRGLVFMAAAIDQNIMDDSFVPVLRAQKIPTTCYILKNNFASGRQDVFRAGPNQVGSFGQQLYLRDGIDLVDITPVIPFPIGDAGLFGVRRIAADLKLTVIHRKSASQRDCVKPVQVGSATIWQVRPSDKR